MNKVILLLIAILLLSAPVTAKEYTYSMEDVGQYSGKESWDKFSQELPEEITNQIIGIDPYSLTTVTDVIKEKTSPAYWLDILWKNIKSSAFGYTNQIVSVISMIMILSMSKLIIPDTIPEVTSAYQTFGSVAIIISLFIATSGVINAASTHLENICCVMNTLTPVMEAVYLAEGALTQLAISTGGVMLVVTAVGNINSTLMIPCTNMLFTLSAVSSICDGVKLSGLTNSIRKFIMRTWQIVTIGFSFMLGTQSIIASSADSLASKTVKFALGSIIPMAGGVLAEAFNTVKEGLSFVRGATGIGGIIVIILLTIPGVIPLVVYKLLINFTSMLAEALSIDKTANFLDEIKGIMDIVIAIVLYTSLMLIFALILFARSQVA